MYKPDINRLLYPRSVAVAGASNAPGKVGQRVLSNLLKMGFPGAVYPVNARENEVMGLQCYPSISDIPIPADLAIITVPTQSVKDVVAGCVSRGVGAAVVITAGFSEQGKDGAELERVIAAMAREGGLALVGPNCVGVISTHAGLYCDMMPVYPEKGQIAIISQSGSVADMMASQISERGMGISSMVSVGNEALLRVEDYLEFLAGDGHTKVIALYAEGLRGGRTFYEAARRATRQKPVVMLKAGSSPVGARAAFSHTAALAGSDMVTGSLLRQAGVLRVYDMDEMVDVAMAFCGQPLPAGNRVGIISPGGGWGVMMADSCASAGLQVADLDEATLGKLNAELPPFWSHANPVDTVTGAFGDPVKIVSAMLESPRVDGLVVLGMVGGIGVIFEELHSRGADMSAGDFARSSTGRFKSYFHSLMELRDRYGKPLVATLSLPISSLVVMDAAAAATRETGTACFTSFMQASRAYAALSRYAGYLRNK